MTALLFLNKSAAISSLKVSYCNIYYIYFACVI